MRLPRVIAPTLVPASAQDRFVPADQAHVLLAGIPSARYAEIDTGHAAPAEDPAGFVASLAGSWTNKPPHPAGPN